MGVTENIKKHPLYKNFLERKIYKRKRLLSMINENTSDEKQKEKRKFAEIELKRMEEML